MLFIIPYGCKQFQMGFYWMFIYSIFQTLLLNLSIKTLICLASILIFARSPKICEALVCTMHIKQLKSQSPLHPNLTVSFFSCWTTNKDALNWTWHKINAILHFTYHDLSVTIMAVIFFLPLLNPLYEIDCCYIVRTNAVTFFNICQCCVAFVTSDCTSLACIC